MPETEYRLLVGVIDAYLRNEPHHFLEATAWVRSHRTPPPEDAPHQPRRHGYDGYHLRTFECMWDLAQQYRSRLHNPHPPPIDDESSVTKRAFRVLLVAWLLSKRSAMAAADKKIRPTGCGPLPLLDDEQVRRIERKFRLTSSPRWRAFVRDAWGLVGDSAYEQAPIPTTTTTDSPESAVDDSRPPARPPKKCELRAFYTHLQAIDADPAKLGTTKAQYTRAQYEHVKLHGSEAYGGHAKLPEYGTWARYVRECLSYFEGTLGKTPSLAETARLLRLDDA